jgi:phytoene dehydrogenase-like protein
MSQKYRYDAIVVGSGPNGLAAAITIARAGYSVCVYEARETIGGGCRSAELTLPGFMHDVCSAIHPMGLASPFLRSLPLTDYGLEWLHPTHVLAHPFDDGRAAVLDRSLETTCQTLGVDADAYRQFMQPLVDDWENILQTFAGPLRPGLLAQHPIKNARFGLAALQPANLLARLRFRGRRARALFAGISAHSMLSLDQITSAGGGLLLGLLGHASGWPLARGGSQQIVVALAAYLRALGGEIITNHEVRSLGALPPSRVVLCDVTPRQLLNIAGERVSGLYKYQLRRYRYGPGSFKIDLALDGPIPWCAEACRRAGTVHLGGTLGEIAASESAIKQGKHPLHPYVLVAQQSLFDETRAPTGKQAVWAYCHVPNGSDFDMTERIEAQIERFAPGFRDRILARHVIGTDGYERYNPNYIGGDINGGIQDLWQFFTRPAIQPNPYTTSDPGLFLCSSSTPPGGGVHGLCGYYAAQTALRQLRKNATKHLSC